MTVAPLTVESDPPARRGGTADAAEIARFAALAEEWWNPNGPFRPLHDLNPLRLAYIRDQALAQFGGRPGRTALAGLGILDVGCGGGLLTEPLCRLGAGVVGIDAADAAIGVARAHAAQGDLDIDYRCTTAEALAATGARFDVVLAMEIVEHVADLGGFCVACGELLKPNGLMIVATLNRTLKAFALAIVGAEYVLGWIPPGTHDWRKFVRPHELARGLRAAGLTLRDVRGVTYQLLGREWRLSRDTDVNYVAAAVKA